MTPRERRPGARRAAALGLACALAGGACSYDLSRLRRDASVGEDAPTPTDVTMMDRPPGDAPVPMPCTTRPTINANEIPNVIGGTIVTTGSTTGAPNMLLPPRFGAACDRVFTGASPEVVYRYQMSGGGTRLLATTDAPNCGAMLDTVVYVLTACNMADPDAGGVLACSDDDRVLSGCACGMGCPGFSSSALASRLTAGQIVYVVVDGFNTNSGNYRLLLTENGVVNAPPPVTPPTGLTLADRCGCAAGSDLVAQYTVPFPRTGDTITSATRPRLSSPGDQIQGMRRMPTARFGAVALEARLNAVRRDPGSRCDGFAATFDLVINSVVVHSFVIDAQTPAPAPMRVVYQTFAPVTAPTTTDVPVALRLREFEPMDCNGAVEFDLAMPGTLTMLGQ